MADIPSTWPDNYVELNQQQTPSHYEKILGKDYPVLSQKIWGVVFDMNKNLITILESPEVKQNPKREINELNNEIQEKHSDSLSKIQDNEHIKTAIENWTIKVFETPSSEVLAISVWSNLDYLYYKDWTLLFSFKWKRDDPALSYPAFLWFSSRHFSEVDKWNWIYKIVVNWQELDPFSEDSINEYYKWWKFMEKMIKRMQYMHDNWDTIQKEEWEWKTWEDVWL